MMRVSLLRLVTRHQIALHSLPNFAQVGALREQLRIEKAGKAAMDNRNESCEWNMAALEEQLLQLEERLRVEQHGRRRAEEVSIESITPMCSLCETFPYAMLR